MRNKFPGDCVRCGKPVAAHAGHPERRDGRWRVRCLDCVGKGDSLHEGPAVIFLPCGGREKTWSTTKITVKDRGE
jgi:hypothetical protein